MKVPTLIDRYPAKMVGRLAHDLVRREVCSSGLILDPFCGSGAILRAAQAHGLPSFGLDVNPYAALLSRVKTEGFDRKKALQLWNDVRCLRRREGTLPMNWPRKDYWFPREIRLRFEEFRWLATRLSLKDSPEGRALLLALALAARPCSRADQRSPKPFISKRSRLSRSDLAGDPLPVMGSILESLVMHYGGKRRMQSDVLCRDVTEGGDLVEAIGERPAGIITSPPYINAQDYFRNSKLELHLLDGVLSFDLHALKGRFIGTERQLPPKSVVTDEAANRRRRMCAELLKIEARNAKTAIVVHHYFAQMERALRAIIAALKPRGSLVIVCGDNLVAGVRVPTWRVLNRLIADEGCHLISVRADRIRSRSLAPRRAGHKGLIKQEWICTFRK